MGSMWNTADSLRQEILESEEEIQREAAKGSDTLSIQLQLADLYNELREAEMELMKAQPWLK